MFMEMVVGFIEGAVIGGLAGFFLGMAVVPLAIVGGVIGVVAVITAKFM